jgi:hypothetical protein
LPLTEVAGFFFSGLVVSVPRLPRTEVALAMGSFSSGLVDAVQGLTVQFTAT